MVISLPAPKRSSRYYKTAGSPYNEDLPVVCSAPSSSTTAFLTQGNHVKIKSEQQSVTTPILDDDLSEVPSHRRTFGSLLPSFDRSSDMVRRTTPARLDCPGRDLEHISVYPPKTSALTIDPKHWSRDLTRHVRFQDVTLPEEALLSASSQRSALSRGALDLARFLPGGLWNLAGRLTRYHLLTILVAMLAWQICYNPRGYISKEISPTVRFTNNLTSVASLVDHIYDKHCGLDKKVDQVTRSLSHSSLTTTKIYGPILDDMKINLETHYLPSARHLIRARSDKARKQFMEDHNNLQQLLKTLQTCVDQSREEIMAYQDCAKRKRSETEDVLYSSSKENSTFLNNLNNNTVRAFWSCWDPTGTKSEAKAERERRTETEDWLSASADDMNLLKAVLDKLWWTKTGISEAVEAFERFEKWKEEIYQRSTDRDTLEWEGHFVKLLASLVLEPKELWYSS
ncbi:hypothetical protein KCV07_g867, partial [Aureobasidium melanogenum]